MFNSYACFCKRLRDGMKYSKMPTPLHVLAELMVIILSDSLNGASLRPFDAINNGSIGQKLNS